MFNIWFIFKVLKVHWNIQGQIWEINKVIYNEKSQKRKNFSWVFFFMFLGYFGLFFFSANVAFCTLWWQGDCSHEAATVYIYCIYIISKIAAPYQQHETQYNIYIYIYHIFIYVLYIIFICAFSSKISSGISKRYSHR